MKKTIFFGLLAFSITSAGCGVDSATTSTPQAAVANIAIDSLAARTKIFNGEYTGYQPAGLFRQARGEACFVRVKLTPATVEQPETLEMDIKKSGPYWEANSPETKTTKILPLDDAKGLNFQEGKAGKYSYGRLGSVTSRVEFEWNDQQIVKAKQFRIELGFLPFDVVCEGLQRIN